MLLDLYYLSCHTLVFPDLIKIWYACLCIGLPNKQKESVFAYRYETYLSIKNIWHSKQSFHNYFIKLSASRITNTIRITGQEKFTSSVSI